MRSIAAVALVLCLGGMARGQSKVYEPHNTTAILKIRFAQDEGLASAGTCVMVDGYHAVTAGHVVGGSDATIETKDGDVLAKVVAIDLYHDRALLRAVKQITTKWRSIREEVPKEGEAVYAIGFGGNGFGYTRGSVRGAKLTGRAILGDSGGPICDQQGRIVGIITGYSPDGLLVSLGRKSLRKWVQENIGNDPVELGSKE